MSWKYIVGGICIFFIGGILGVLITSSSLGDVRKGVQSGTGTSQTVDTTSSNYQAGFDAAKKLVEDSSLGNFFKTQDDVRSISGTVTAIDGNRIAIHDESIGNPFDGLVPSDRTIIVGIDTRVIKLTGKTSAEIQAEMDTFVKAQKTLDTSVTSTTPYIETSVDASSIQVGDSLIVTANKNVKTFKEFAATEIQIQPKMFTK